MRCTAVMLASGAIIHRANSGRPKTSAGANTKYLSSRVRTPMLAEKPKDSARARVYETMNDPTRASKTRTDSCVARLSV